MDKMMELAKDVVAEFDKGWRGAPHFELVMRMKLEPLLDAAQDLLNEDLCEGRRTIEQDGSEPEKRLAAELQGWRATSPTSPEPRRG